MPSVRFRSVLTDATGSFLKLMLFYFILVATSLTPNPFAAANEHSFAIYFLIALIYSCFIAAFWHQPGSNSKVENTSVSSEAATSQSKHFWASSANRFKLLSQDFLLFFSVITLLLGLIQLLHMISDKPAPLPLTDMSVVLAVVVACLLGALLSSARLK